VLIVMKAEYGGPGRYQISIQGCVPESWANRLGSMRIDAVAGGQEAGVTTLTGVVADQAELAGILSALQALRLPLLSVQRLDQTAGSRD
jgi:hypothetical protein